MNLEKTDSAIYNLIKRRGASKIYYRADRLRKFCE